MLEKLKSWNTKYDIWSFSNDFILVFGVIVLDWSPLAIILLFIIDTIVMLPFTYILFHKETKDWVKTFGFSIIAIVVISFLFAFYNILWSVSVDLDLLISSDPFELIPIYVLPLILCSSALNHYAAFDESLHKLREGTYQSSFIKHFFLRYILMICLIVTIALFFLYFNLGIIIALIGLKAVLRVINKRIRTII